MTCYRKLIVLHMQSHLTPLRTVPLPPFNVVQTAGFSDSQKKAHFLVFSTLQREEGEKSAKCPKIIGRDYGIPMIASYSKMSRRQRRQRQSRRDSGISSAGPQIGPLIDGNGMTVNLRGLILWVQNSVMAEKGGLLKNGSNW